MYTCSFSVLLRSVWSHCGASSVVTLSPSIILRSTPGAIACMQQAIPPALDHRARPRSHNLAYLANARLRFTDDGDRLPETVYRSTCYCRVAFPCFTRCTYQLLLCYGGSAAISSRTVDYRFVKRYYCHQGLYKMRRRTCVSITVVVSVMFLLYEANVGSQWYGLVRILDGWYSINQSYSYKVSSLETQWPHLRIQQSTAASQEVICAACSEKINTNSMDMHLPHPWAFKDLSNADWMSNLKRITVHKKQVILLQVTSAFKDALINWLIAAFVTANPPLTDLSSVIILVFDYPELHNLLTIKGFNSLLLNTTMFLNDSFRAKHRQRVWLGRMAIIRIMNYWGIEAMSIDVDALVLRNPQVLFKAFPNADIIGSVGVWNNPHWAVCMGMILFRYNSRIGE